MKLQHHFFSVALLALLCACNNPTSNTAISAIQKDSLAKDSLQKLAQKQDSAQNSNVADEFVLDTIFKLKFREFSLTINRLACFDEDKKLANLQEKDTVNAPLELGESLEGQTLNIQTDQLTDILVEQSHENSIVVSDEGRHCDLVEWKHYVSPWQPLKATAEGNYTCAKYTQKDYALFPKVSLEEIKKNATAICGEEWAETISKIKDFNKENSSTYATLSYYVLRITGKRKDNGQIVTKIIRLESPMGC